MEQGGVATGFEVSQLAVTKTTGAEAMFLSSHPCLAHGATGQVVLVSWAWLGGLQTGGAHWQGVEGQLPQTSG